MNLINSEYLSSQNAIRMKGLCAIIIVLHHASTMLPGNVLFNFIFNKIGASVAAVFFFYSGYGLML